MLSAKKARSIWKYDPNTGLLWWQERASGRQMQRPAGSPDGNGYIGIGHKGKIYKAHRIIWLIQTGRWPKNEIDHRNGKRDDNRWSNLRQATRAQNKRNYTTYKNNTSGHRGVFWHKQHQKWYVVLQRNRRRFIVGLFDDFEIACKAYKKESSVKFGEFARAQ